MATIQPAISTALRNLNETPELREELSGFAEQMNQRIETIEGELRAYAARGPLAVTDRSPSVGERGLESACSPRS